jgi:hypothetical protein
VDVLAVRFAGATANFGWLAGGAIASAAWRRLAMAPPPGDAVTRASPRALRAHRAELLALSIPMLLGILVRIAPVAGAGFPVGDGGMFYAMVCEVQQAGMAIPAATTCAAARDGPQDAPTAAAPGPPGRGPDRTPRSASSACT